MIIRRAVAIPAKVRASFSQTQQAADEAFSQKTKKHGVLLGPILAHVESAPFRARFELKKYLHSHAWCCLHAWLLDFRSRAFRNPWGEVAGSLLLRRQLASSLEAFNYSQMEKFSDRRDREIYYELKRISNVIHFALDDRFHYGLAEKPLAQIVCEDMGLYPQGQLSEGESANVGRVEEYIEAKMQQLKQTPISLLRSGGFKWEL